MTAQLKRIQITRPWMELGIFKSHSWRLPSLGNFSTISTGNPADPSPGIMPLIVTGLLLARNLSATGSWDPDAKAKGLPKSLGPFALAPPPRDLSVPLRTYAGEYGNNLSIRVEGVQIIGFFCEPVPKSPSPDPKFFR